jgi:outer membrane protein assembly factor BamA
VAEGRLRSAFAGAEYDTRNEARDPSAGWLLRGELELGLDGSLERPIAVDFEQEEVLSALPADERFAAAVLDVRRYARFTPYSFLAVRLLAMGSIDGGPLPTQRQHALGGEGSLPGYDRFEFDCGARNERLIAEGTPRFPWYGCDRLALVQLEYQAGFPFARRLTERIGLRTGHAVRWVAFFDAGRAWTEPAARGVRQGGQNDFAADAGLGIRFGAVGVYWAFPLSGNADGVNFLVRLGRRF